ncbi:MAG: tetratricopeptide repeat protein [Verrucomicrobia bacterium]|nr:tetratricopeptide repeat protein [Verrucomicrobiota bacterium]
MSHKFLLVLILYHIYLSTAYTKSSNNEKTYHTFEIQLKIHLADVHLNEGKIEEALGLFRQLVRKRKRELEPQEREKIVQLSYKISLHIDQLLSQAENLFKDKKYNQAGLLYHQLKLLCKKHCLPHTLSKQSRRQFLYSIHYRLACCYFLDGEYQKTVSTMSEGGNESYFLLKGHKKLFWQWTFMKGAAYKKMGIHKQARELFSACAQSSDCSLQKEAQVEAAFCAFQLRKNEIAQRELSLLNEETLSDDIFTHTSILKILLCVAEKEFDSAHKALDTLTNQPASQHAFLQGYLSYALGDLDTAVIHFEKSIHDPARATDALYFLGYIYMEMAARSALSPFQEQLVYIERAKNCYEALISHSYGHKKERAYLGLGLALFAKAQYESKQVTKKKLELLLSEASPNISEKIHYELSLLIAECCETAEESREHYSVLLDKRYQPLSSYPKAFFMRGSRLVEEDAHLGRAMLQEASIIAAQRQTICLKPKAHEAYRWLEILSLQKQMLVDRSYSSETLPHALHGFFTDYPESPYANDAVHYLALLYWKRQEYAQSLDLLQSLLIHFPFYHKRDEALFFAARNLEQLYGKTEESSRLYLELYSNFPSSVYAPESYFRYYSEQEYLSGSEKALLHLRNMPESMSDSPIAAVASFYVGCHFKELCPDKNISEAHVKYLTKAIEAFELAQTRGAAFPHLQLLSLYSALEKAKTYFILGNYEQCEQSLLQFKTQKEPLPTKLVQESFWLHARMHMLKGQKNEAREELEALIEYCTLIEEPASELNIQALCSLAAIKGQEGLFEDAHVLLLKAEELQKGGCSRELLLEIWINKSEIYRREGKLEKAMALLSKAINDDCASSLRIHAMYLRAEIYELKGRKDLAAKQLEAIAKKGGISKDRYVYE